MNNFINNMERKFGRFAVRNLTMYVIAVYVIGYVMQIFRIGGLFEYMLLDPARILHGEVWRLISWVFVPSSSFGLLTLITLFFYYVIGNNMERTMGTFRYNLFIFGGMLLMIIGAFIAYLFFYISGPATAEVNMYNNSPVFNMIYLQEMVFLAFAICYPDMQVLLMFIIPIKVKWMGIAYGIILVVECINGLMDRNYAVFFAIGSQLLNLFLFYLQTGRLSRFKPKDVKRRHDFSKNMKMTPKGVTRHKCAVCGRTEETNPELEFRFCSKCNGNYEYCQDHLFTHQHVK